MKPSRGRADAVILRSQVRSFDGTSILAESGGFTPTKWFVAQGQIPLDTREPAKKRRKLNKPEKTPQCPVNGNHEMILLSDVVIDFSFPRGLVSEDLAPDAPYKDEDFSGCPSVSLLVEEVVDDGKYTLLRLRDCRREGLVLTIECLTLPRDVLDVLEHYAVRTLENQRSGIGDTDPGNSRRNATHHSSFHKPSDATVLSCTLTQLHDREIMRLHLSFHWKSGVSAVQNSLKINKETATLLRLFPNEDREAVGHDAIWTPQDFYESMQTGSETYNVDASTFAGILDTELYPFQKRAVAWMLEREGVEYSDSRTKPLGSLRAKMRHLPFYTTGKDANGRTCYINHLQGMVSRHEPVSQTAVVSGGLLAEEMGLGKTVEFTALVALHQRSEPFQIETRNSNEDSSLVASKATLIVTPTSILKQWLAELSRHAPALRIHRYSGMSDVKDKSPSALSAKKLALATEYDIVITTYADLAREIYYADDPPERNMRHARKYERTRSPLVEVEWWRVCLDESQMAENPESNPARVASRLPRIHSWAISGTPLKKNVAALQGLLAFLRCEPFCDDPKMWSQLISNHKHLFRKLFGMIAFRHTKAQIRDELHLPPQKRMVITIPFSVVEQQNYAELFSSMCDDVGVNADGSPQRDYWDPDDPATVEKMRNWLVRLRQTCLHPRVGAKNRKALGRGQRPLRTVSEVLEVMIDQNDTNLRVETRLATLAGLNRAHVLGNDKSNEHRSERALEIYLSLLQSTEDATDTARERLANAKAAQEAEESKGKKADENNDPTESYHLLLRLQTVLRTSLELQHTCAFFAATAYYQIKANETLTVPDSEQFKDLEEKETSLYERAKAIRKEILLETSGKADGFMKTITELKERVQFVALPTIEDLPDLGGIQSRRIAERSDDLYALIREQANVMVQWRSKMADFLLRPLVDEDDEETTGEEYESSTKQQDELYVYFDALKAMQADLNNFVTGEAAPLIDHEAQFQIKAARRFLDPEELNKPSVHAPELLLELYRVRNGFRKRVEGVGSLRGLIQEARLLENSLIGSEETSRVAAERSIVKRYQAMLQHAFSQYSKVLSGLEKELDLFRSTQNHRVEFYRQLQELSDAVAPYKDDLDETLDASALESITRKIETHEGTLAQLRTKQRFLQHVRDESGENSESRICVICRHAFERGVLTVCGHQYCKECIQAWFSQARTCPICKRGLGKNDLHDITYNPRELRAQEEEAPRADKSSTNSSSASSEDTDRSETAAPTSASIYTAVDSQVMDDIQAIDLPTSYGTKIDTLGRHLLYIRAHDFGAKSIVFSQYRDFLDVLGQAFRDFHVRYARLGHAGAVEKFRNDPSIDCLLLDAKTDSSGLTLVNATHVFICEPLIQTAVELQAIARVHRIGQTRPTTVWMYLVRDTVEEAIYRISVQRRWAHVQSRAKTIGQRASESTVSTAPLPVTDDVAIDAANSAQLQASSTTNLLASGKSAGEMVATHDLWQCLFGGAG